MKEEVKAIKFITGEEIIAKIEDLGDEYKLYNPMRFLMVPTEAGVQLTAQPFVMLSNDHEFIVSKNSVITMASPVDEIYNAWNSQFGSGIVTPPEKHIIT